MDIRHLTAPAASLGVRVEVTVVDGIYRLDDRGVAALERTIIGARHAITGTDGAIALRLLRTRYLSERDMLALARALDGCHRAIQRDRNIRQGRIPGALSAREALTVSRRFGR